MAKKPKPQSETLTFTAELRAMVKRADEGDEKALAELRKFLDQNPHLWRELGDLARHAEKAQIEIAAGSDRLLAACIKLTADDLREELTKLPGSTLERLLVDRAVVSWIQAYAADFQTGAPDRHNANWFKFLEKRRDQAHRRYVGALRELSRLQKQLEVEDSVDPQTVTKTTAL